MFSPVLLQEEALSIQGSSFKDYYGTQSLHQGPSSPGRVPQNEQSIQFLSLDDILIKSASRDQARRDVQQTLECQQELSFINMKISLTPAQEMEHHGLQINSKSFTVALSKERQDNIQNLLLNVRQAQPINLMTLASLQSMMESCQDVVDSARFHMRPL